MTRFKTLVGATLLAASASLSPATAATYDLAFIMDSSGSLGSSNYFSAMDALASALQTHLTADVLADDDYNITVLTFATDSATVVAPTLVSDVSDLDGIVSAVTSTDYSAGFTNYTSVFERLLNESGALTVGAAGSIINMMTDGNPTKGGDADEIHARVDDLNNAGWSALGFESVTSAADSSFLQSLTFDTNSSGDGAILTDPNDINDPLNNTFVLEVSDFGAAYAQAIDAKVSAIVAPPPDPNVVPLPGALPLMAGGIGLLGMVRLGRRRKS